MRRIREQRTLVLDGRREIPFHEQDHLHFRIDKTLAFHSNGMRFTAYGDAGAIVLRKIFFSVGGGFVVDEAEVKALADVVPLTPASRLTFIRFTMLAGG